MSIYENKSANQIKKAITDYLEAYESRTGRKPNPTQIGEMFLKAIEMKEQAMFDNAFGTFTPKSLLDAYSLLNTEPAADKGEKSKVHTYPPKSRK